MDDYRKFLEVLMMSNKKVWFGAICNLEGELLFQKRREDIRTLFSLEETKEQLSSTIKSWKSRSEIKEKIESPALLVIGKNVLLAPILNWFKVDEINYFYQEKLLKKNYGQYKSI